GIRAVHGLQERHGGARAAGRGEPLGVDLPEPLVEGVRLPDRRDHPERLLEEREGTLAAPAHVEETRVIPPRQPEHRIPLTDGPPDLRLRLLVRGFGALVEPEALLLARQVVPRPVSRASQLRPPLLDRLVALFLPEVRIDVRRQPEELDLEVRLGPELLLDAGRTDVEELFRRHLPARLVLGDPRIARAEDSEEEVFRGVRACGLARGAAGLPRRAG